MADGDTHVLMPSMGEGITEATLVKWLKKPGDPVAQDEALLEVSTDKVDTEIPSPADGFLITTFADTGEQVAVGSVIAQISTKADAAVAKPQGAPAAAPKKPAGPSRAGSTTPAQQGARVPMSAHAGGGAVLTVNQGELKSSPLVRKIAQDRGIDLRYVPGSGLAGRITRRDVDEFIDRGGMQAVPYAAAKAPAHLEVGRLETSHDGEQERLEGVVVRREPMAKMRTLIAEHMVRSKKSSAHAYMDFEVDLARVVALREAEKASFQKTHGFNLTFTPFFIHAAIQGIKAHPVVNVSVDGEDVLWKDDINIGCAVALEDGLIVPVLKKSQDMSLVQVAQGLNDLVVRARSKKLQPADVQGGTFSITNPGMFGSHAAMPIINQPQVAIMVVNGIQKKPVVASDNIVIRPMINIGLTFDHRVIDGEGAARFLAAIKTHLETLGSVT